MRPVPRSKHALAFYMAASAKHERLAKHKLSRQLRVRSMTAEAKYEDLAKHGLPIWLQMRSTTTSVKHECMAQIRSTSLWPSTNFLDGSECGA